MLFGCQILSFSRSITYGLTGENFERGRAFGTGSRRVRRVWVLPAFQGNLARFPRHFVVLQNFSTALIEHKPIVDHSNFATLQVRLL
jgi:hypothetical protein